MRIKYKLFLYHYPTFERISYNGRMLGEAIFRTSELKDHINDGKKIDILAHSMGGLVARSFIEEHGVGYAYADQSADRQRNPSGTFKQVKTGETTVANLLTLATPHRGSISAVKEWNRQMIGIELVDDHPVIEDFGIGDLANELKELDTPGAISLSWDNFDDIFTRHSKLEEYFRNNDYDQRIDSDFSDLFDVPKITLTRGDLTVNHPNTWLKKLNTNHFEKNFKKKLNYLFYAGSANTINYAEFKEAHQLCLNASLSEAPVISDLPVFSKQTKKAYLACIGSKLLIEGIIYWSKEKFLYPSLGLGISASSYAQHYTINDGAVSSQSAFLDELGEYKENTSYLNLDISDYNLSTKLHFEHVEGKHATHGGSFDLDFLGNTQAIFRYFHDYDHDKMRGGAGAVDAKKGETVADFENEFEDSIESKYLSSLGFDGYVDDFQSNPLHYDPLFLSVARDLGNASSGKNYPPRPRLDMANSDPLTVQMARKKTAKISIVGNEANADDKVVFNVNIHPKLGGLSVDSFDDGRITYVYTANTAGKDEFVIVATDEAGESGTLSVAVDNVGEAGEIQFASSWHKGREGDGEVSLKLVRSKGKFWRHEGEVETGVRTERRERRLRDGRVHGFLRQFANRSDGKGRHYGRSNPRRSRSVHSVDYGHYRGR